MSYQPIFEIHESWYDWAWFGVYRHPIHIGRFATLSEYGCSCNDLKEPSDEEVRAAAPVDRASARTDLTDFMTWNKSMIDKGAALRYLERFETAMSEQSA